MFNLFIIILGLIFGSFIANYSYRYPRGIKISEGFSCCDNCKSEISWYENVPVVSYIFLRGKCKNCKKEISIRYPIIESITGLGFVFIYLFQSLLPFHFAFLLLAFCLLEIIFIIDLEFRIIPDDFVFFGISATFFYLLLFKEVYLVPSIFAGLFASAILLSIHIITRGRGMGLGDVKFAIFGGMLVGIRLHLVWLLFSFVIGGMVGIVLILSKQAGLKDKIAFGPFLIISILFTFMYGNKLTLFLGY